MDRKKDQNGEKQQQNFDISTQQKYTEKLLDFYFEDFMRIISQFKRNSKISIILTILNCLQLISLMYSSNKEHMLNTPNDQLILSNILQILEFSKIYPLFTSAFQIENDLQIIVIICFTLNILTLIYLGFRFIFAMFFVQNEKTGQFHFYDQVSSFFSQIFNHILLIPFGEVSIKIFQNQDQNSFEYPIALINIIITLTFSIVFMLHDFDYSFIVKDFLAQRESHWRIIFLLEDIVLIVISQINLGVTIFLLHFIFVLTKLFIYSKEIPYYIDIISELYVQGLFIHISLSILSIIFEVTTIKDYSDFSIVLIIIILPITRYGSIYKDQLKQKIFAFKQIDLLNNPLKLDLYIRELQKLMNLNYINYCQQEQGIKFESIYTRHVNNCKIAFSETQNCFCEKFQHELTTDEFLEQDFRKTFLVYYIIDLFQNFFNNCKKNVDTTQLRFSYVAFLIEVFGVPMKALSEIMFLKNMNKNATIKEKYVISALAMQADLVFLSFFHNSLIQNQRLQFQSVMEYDELEGETQKNLRSTIILKRDFFVYLCQDNIDLIEIQNKGQEIINLREQIQYYIQKIYLINNYSKKCLELAQIYCEYLDVWCRSANTFLNSIISRYQIQRKKQITGYIKHDINVLLFDEDASTVFISLMKPIGQIKRVSNNFSKTFQISREDAMNQSCSIIMPQEIGLMHDRFLNNFLESDSLKSLNGEIFTLSLNGKGYLMPLYKRLRLDTYTIYFGMSAYLLQINKSYDYLLIDDRNHLLESTENIYNLCFKRHFNNDQSLLHRLDASKLLLYIGAMKLDGQERSDNLEYITSLMIFPLTYNNLKYFQNQYVRRQERYLELMMHLNFKDFGFLEISFRKIRIDTSVKGISYYYIEIEKIRRLRKTIDKARSLVQLKKQVESNLKINVKVNKDKNLQIQILNTDEFITKQSINDSNDPSAKQSKYESFGILSDNRLHQKFFTKNIRSQSDFQFKDIDITQKNKNINNQQDQIQNKNNIISNTQNQAQDQFEINLVFNNNNNNNVIKYSQNNRGSQPINQQIQGNSSLTNNQLVMNTSLNCQNESQIENTIQNNYYYINNTQEECLIKRNLDPNASASFIKQTDQNSSLYAVNIDQSQILNENNIVNSLKDPDNFTFLQQNDVIQGQQSIKLQSYQQINRKFEREKSITSNSQVKPMQSDLKIEENSDEDDNPQQQNNHHQDNNYQDYYQDNQILDSKFKDIFSVTQTQSLRDQSIQNKVNLKKQQDSQDSMNNVNEDQNNKFGQLAERSSMKSSVSLLHAKKQQYLQIITQSKYTNQIKCFFIIGIISIIILVITTLVLFFITQNNYVKELEYFNRLQQGGELANNFAQIINNVEYIRLDKYQLINERLHPQEIDQLQNDTIDFIYDMRKQLEYVMIDNNEATYKQALYYNNISLIFRDENYDNEITFQSISYQAIYVLLQMMNYLYNYATFPNSEIDKFVIYSNFQKISESILGIQDNTKEQANQELDNTELFLQISLITILVIAFAIIIMALPLYAISQFKRETILKLFGTYPDDKLKQQIYLYDSAAEIINYNSSDINNKKTFIKKLFIQNKRRTISSTTILNKINIKLVLPVAILYSLIAIYPILNTIFINNFLREYRYLVKEQNLISSAQGNLAIQKASHYSTILQRSQNIEYAQKSLNEFRIDQGNKGDTLLKDLYNLEDNILQYQRYNQQQYKDIFLKVIQTNLCDTLKDNSNLLPHGKKQLNYYFDQNKCIDLYDGVMNKGLIITIKLIFKMFDELKQTYEIDQYNLFKESILKWDSAYQIKSLNGIIDYSIIALKSLQNYLQQASDHFYKEQLQNLQGILIYALFVQIFLLGYSVYYFIRYLAIDLYNTRYLISIFNIDFIMENSYIASFLEKELIK